MQIPRRNKVAHRYFVLLLFLPPLFPPFGILALDKFLPDSRESRGGKGLSRTGLRLAGIITIITTIDNGLHRERGFNTRERGEREWQQDGIEGCIQLSRFIPSSPQFFEAMEILLYIYIIFRRSPFELPFSSLPPSLLPFSSSLSADLFPFFVSSLIEASNFRLRLRLRENSKGIVASKLGNDRGREGKKERTTGGRVLERWLIRGTTAYGSRVPDHLKNGWRVSAPREETAGNGEVSRYGGKVIWLGDGAGYNAVKWFAKIECDKFWTYFADNVNGLDDGDGTDSRQILATG